MSTHIDPVRAHPWTAGLAPEPSDRDAGHAAGLASPAGETALDLSGHDSLMTGVLVDCRSSYAQ